jgi:aminoglycoside phosphotransferase (APT) family kinase protein
MTARQLSEVHGHALSELETLLRESCGIFDDEVHLKKEALGGWSNINILGSSSGIEFVLKLPWAIKPLASFYDFLHSVSKYYSNYGITSAPLASGMLDDDKETPFILFEYLPGDTYQNLNELDIDNLRHFKECLNVLYRQKPPDFLLHYSPFEYARAATVDIREDPLLSECSDELNLLFQEFIKTHDSILRYSEEVPWTGKQAVMHGDLWIPNVVFQSEKAFLLDLESCTSGNSHLDLAYLVESPKIPINLRTELPALLTRGFDFQTIDKLRPLALAHIVGWSFDRLLSMEAGFVEPNLNTPTSRIAVMEYTREKVVRLQTMFS